MSQDEGIKPTDLRGILKYVPQFRDHIFVVTLDGSVVEDENFSNIALDIAVMRSLNINIIIVHGIGFQLSKLAEEKKVKLSDTFGQGVIDEDTLALAVEASAQVSHKILKSLTQNGLKCVTGNFIRATEVGVIGGQDQLYRGKVEKIDAALLESLLKKEIIPIVPPIAFTGEGQSLRINSDLLASDLASTLEASKVIFLTSHPGLTVEGEFLMNIPVEEVKKLLQSKSDSIDEKVRDKAAQAIRTIENGVPRAHIIDGRVFDGLITEIFSKVGIGTMIHGNEYQQIRQARRKDVQSIYNLTKNAARTEALRHRTRQSIERDIRKFYVYEIDESIIACCCLIDYENTKTMEISAVYVQPFYKGRGVGKKMVEFAMMEAERLGAERLIALTTQSHSFFKKIEGFSDGTEKDLPESRLKELKESGRNSRILIKIYQER